MATIQVYSITHITTDGYLTSIEIPDYKQLKRIKDFLSDWIRKQYKYDLLHSKIRFYVFRFEDGMVLRESDINH